MAAPVLQFKRGLLANLPGLRAGEPGFTTDFYDLYVGIDSTSANNKFFGSHRYWKRETNSTGSGINLVEGTTNGSQYVTLKSPDSLSGIVTYTLPGTQGTVSSVLTNDGSGNLTWASGSANPVFSGISSFTDTTDNTLGNADTGAVQIDGGLGVNKNVTVGGNLNVQGYSEFVGVVTFRGGTINIGDSNTDNINVAGEFVSNLVPNTDNTYDLGIGTQRWRNLNLSGVGTIGTLDVPGAATVGSLHVNGNASIDGNVTIGGTTVTIQATNLVVSDKDIVIGYTTNPTDTTANHGGIAVASTEGHPLVSLQHAGINTLPDTYKQIMWVQGGTFGVGTTDAWLSNYAFGIGTTQVGNGVRLAVGTGVNITDTAITATTFNGTLNGNTSSADQVKTVTAGNNNSTYYVTFVDSHNGSATNESVYTDDGIYYNPGTNTFTTQHALFTGDVTVSGSLTGTISTATRATTVDTTTTSTNSTYYVPFVSSVTGTNGATVRVGAGLSLNPSDGSVATNGILSVGNAANLTSYIKSGGGSNALYMYANGDVSFQNKAIVNQIRASDSLSTVITLANGNATFGQDIKVTGITTTGTLKLNGTPGIGITGISSSTTLVENSDAYLPTQKAVKAYVDAVDLTLGLNADTGGPSTVNTSQTLTISGTSAEIETSVSGQTVTVGLPDNVTITTALTTPTVKATNLKANDGTTAITINNSTGTVVTNSDLTVSGNLYVNGNTTQVNTSQMTVEDRTIELGIVDGAAPSSTTTWDLGVLFNYYDSSAKKSALIWEQSDARFKLGSVISDGGGTGNSNPQITFTSYAALELAELWVNNSCTGGSSQVIACSGSSLVLQNITLDAGTF